jgi:hypothetical protein
VKSRSERRSQRNKCYSLRVVLVEPGTRNTWHSYQVVVSLPGILTYLLVIAEQIIYLNRTLEGNLVSVAEAIQKLYTSAWTSGLNKHIRIGASALGYVSQMAYFQRILILDYEDSLINIYD